MKEDYVIHEFEKPVKNLLAIRTKEKSFFGNAGQFLIIQHEGVPKIVTSFGVFNVTKDEIAAIPVKEIRDAIDDFDGDINFRELCLVGMQNFAKESMTTERYFNNASLIFVSLLLIPEPNFLDFIDFIDIEEKRFDDEGIKYQNGFKSTVRELRTLLTVKHYSTHPQLIQNFQDTFNQLDPDERRRRYDSNIASLGCDPGMYRVNSKNIHKHNDVERFDLYTRDGSIDIDVYNIDMAYIKRAVNKVEKLGPVSVYMYEQLATNCLKTYGYFTTLDIFGMNIINALVTRSRNINQNSIACQSAHIVFINDKTIFDGCLKNSDRYIKMLRQFASIDYSESKFADHITVKLAAHPDLAVRRNLAINGTVPEVVRENLLAFDDIKEELAAMRELKDMCSTVEIEG